MTSSIIDSNIFAPLFHSQEMRNKFNDDARAAGYLEAEAALARAQGKIGMIPSEAAKRISQAAHEIRIDMDELCADTGTVGYPILGLVRQLARAAGEEAGGYVHWGATTQDIMDTGSVLQIRDGLDLIERDLARVLTALASLADKHRDTVMAGRTHLQHALPVTFGYKAAVWLDSLNRTSQRLQEIRPRVLKVQLGGAAGTLASMGTGAEQVTALFAEELGLETPVIPWHSTRDTFAETVCTLALLTGSLSKIAFDIMIMAMTEIDEVSEPFVKDRGASSTMPQKRNPISCEVIRGCHQGVSEAARLLLGAQEADFERATGPWHAEWMALPNGFVLAHCAVSQAAFLLEGLVVKPEKMRSNLEMTRGLIVAEAAMMALAPHLGRQVSHDVVYEACRRSESEGATLLEVLSDNELVSHRLSRTQLEQALAPENYLGLAQHFVGKVLA
ncbi:3-carboxy-cis,cis-muconate cycloisomerase [Halomonas daqingensis]|uniref:3-carboxy-cis,cis-muconate cycloisomerase n=1 Tax=Billgrantia desiderata TaxID=52021 RepID=A0ABS9B9Z9_9GAMM|nr:3-carboxy-cis,cis-muconate cycloisomerase [Halomonas desiderata]MCE8043980.1 3-carboxy-cis,cis-muconate cycloisomerase [Halomonas desiderata]MCE8048554.1 3-carboxy-cis,cis-muconate cycloisomerase [Halomonas desiderata]